jgi:hypothetical protein
VHFTPEPPLFLFHPAIRPATSERSELERRPPLSIRTLYPTEVLSIAKAPRLDISYAVRPVAPAIAPSSGPGRGLRSPPPCVCPPLFPAPISPVFMAFAALLEPSLHVCVPLRENGTGSILSSATRKPCSKSPVDGNRIGVSSENFLFFLAVTTISSLAFVLSSGPG